MRKIDLALLGMLAVSVCAARADGPIENGAKTCREGAPGQAGLVVSENIRAGTVSGGKMEVIDYADRRIPARRFLVPVSMANAYGAHIGSRNIVCFTSEDGMRLLKIE